MRARVAVMLIVAAWTIAVGAAFIAASPGLAVAGAMRGWHTSFAGNAALIVATPLLAVSMALAGGAAFFLLGSFLDSMSAKLMGQGQGNPIPTEGGRVCGVLPRTEPQARPRRKRVSEPAAHDAAQQPISATRHEMAARKEQTQPLFDEYH